MKPRDKQAMAEISPRTVHLDPASPSHDGHAVVSSDRPPHIIRRLVRRFFQVLLPLAILAAAYSHYNYLVATRPEAKKRPVQEVAYAVNAIPIAFGTEHPRLTLYGATVAGREVELRSLVAGRVIATGSQLQSGGEVSDGDLLLKIDPFDYQMAIEEADALLAETQAKHAETEASIRVEEGNLASARLQLDLARVDLKRAEPLARRGTISKRTLDDRRLVAFQREQTVVQLENSLKVWEARKAQQMSALSRLETSVKRAQRRLEETKLHAPFNAYVTNVGAQVGRMMNVNDRVATLVDRDWIDARFTLTDDQYGRLIAQDNNLIGKPISVKWRIGRKPIVYKAKIERIAANVAAETGGVQVYARLVDPLTPVPIRPGAFVEVDVADTRYDRVAKVPGETVYDGETAYVIVDGRLQSRKIAVVGTSGSDLLIEGDIVSGERVLVTRLARPGDGLLVRER